MTFARELTAAMALVLGLTAQASAEAPAHDGDDIAGVVTSRFGPEAGVWVIAETTGLGVRFAKIVVTDAQGRYVIPDLPKASYRVWVRGYGLVDSPKVAAEPGAALDLAAEVAPDLARAAQYYPPIYWLSLLKVPDRGKFPGTGPSGNGVPENFKTQEQWLDLVKTNGCAPCHQLGNVATRTLPATLGHFQFLGGRLAAAPAIRTGGNGDDQHHRPARTPRTAASWRCLRTGPTASPRANCRMKPRRARAGGAQSCRHCARLRRPGVCRTISR